MKLITEIGLEVVRFLLLFCVTVGVLIIGVMVTHNALVAGFFATLAALWVNSRLTHDR